MQGKAENRRSPKPDGAEVRADRREGREGR